jgi:hypothetical protein
MLWYGLLFVSLYVRNKNQIRKLEKDLSKFKRKKNWFPQAVNEEIYFTQMRNRTGNLITIV